MPNSIKVCHSVYEFQISKNSHCGLQYSANFTLKQHIPHKMGGGLTFNLQPHQLTNLKKSVFLGMKI